MLIAPNSRRSRKKSAPGFPVIRQLERFDRHRAAHHETVEVGEHAADLAGNEKIGDKKGVAQLLRVQQRHVLGSRHSSNGVGKHGAEITAGIGRVNARNP